MPRALSITPLGKTTKIEQHFRRLPKLYKEGIRDAAFVVGSELTKTVERMLTTGKRTGVHYFGNPHRSSAPGEPPRSQTGRLVTSIYFHVRGSTEIRIGERADYAEGLEFGTERVAPRPHMIVAIARRERDVEQYLYNIPLKKIKP